MKRYILIDLEKHQSEINSTMVNLLDLYKDALIIESGALKTTSILSNASTYILFDNRVVEIESSLNSFFLENDLDAIVIINRALIPTILNFNKKVSFSSKVAYLNMSHEQIIDELELYDSLLISNSRYINDYSILIFNKMILDNNELSKAFHKKNIKAISFNGFNKKRKLSQRLSEDIKEMLMNSKYLKNKEMKSILFMIKVLNDKNLLGINFLRNNNDPRVIHFTNTNPIITSKALSSRVLRKLSAEHNFLSSLNSYNFLFNFIKVTLMINNYNLYLADQILKAANEFEFSLDLIVDLFRLSKEDIKENLFYQYINEENILEVLAYLNRNPKTLNIIKAKAKKDIYFDNKMALPLDIRNSNMIALNQMLDLNHYPYYPLYFKEADEYQSAAMIIIEEYILNIFRELGIKSELIIPLVYERINFSFLLKKKFYLNHLLKSRGALRRYFKLDFFFAMAKELKKDLDLKINLPNIKYQPYSFAKMKKSKQKTISSYIKISLAYNYARAIFFKGEKL